MIRYFRWIDMRGKYQAIFRYLYDQNINTQNKQATVQYAHPSTAK